VSEPGELSVQLRLRIGRTLFLNSGVQFDRRMFEPEMQTAPRSGSPILRTSFEVSTMKGQLGRSLDVNQNVSAQSSVESRLGIVNQLEKQLIQ
jgi:hypothetical protein